MTTTKAFAIKGTTDDVTTCGICGREDLKRTIVLAELDADGNEDGRLYAGSECGARAAGWTQSDFAKRLRVVEKAEDTARRAAEQAARDARSKADDELFFAYVRETYGLTITSASELWGAVDGKTPFEIRKEFRASR